MTVEEIRSFLESINAKEVVFNMNGELAKLVSITYKCRQRIKDDNLCTEAYVVFNLLSQESNEAGKLVEGSTTNAA